MIEFGCVARYFNDYRHEVEFAKANSFSFMQIWYDNKGLNLKQVDELLPVIMDEGFPLIIHALLDVNEIPDQITILRELLLKLGHKQLIVHPVCKSEPITDKTIHKLVENMKTTVERLKYDNITVFIENNSRLDPIFTSSEELEIMFSDVPELEFLLDVAHMDSLEHLNKLVSVKTPKIIHIADRRLEEIHEHLPIGHGNIDFKRVFSEVLPGFEGKIIFEIIQSNEAIIAARKYFENLLCLDGIIKLIKPTIDLKQEYLDMIDEWKQSNEKIVPWVLNVDSSDFQSMVSRFEDYSKGIGLKEGMVPHSTYWLVRDDDKILGVINIRHWLNDHLKYIGGHIGYGIRPSERRKGYATAMLRMALDIVHKMGIKSVLITCDKDNYASARTIIRNGGILNSEDVNNGTIFQRYWIDLSK